MSSPDRTAANAARSRRRATRLGAVEHRGDVTPSLWRHADFLKLWTGQTISELGSVVTRTAIPLVALLVLGAGPAEMALLVVAGRLAILRVGFFAGDWG